MIDWSKPIQTRNGRSARVLATDLKGTSRPMVVAITTDDSDEYVFTYQLNGRMSSSERWGTEPNDIINVLEKPLTYKEWFTTYGVCGFSVAVAESYADYRVQFDRDHRDHQS